MLKKKEKLICSFENITLQEERVTKLKGMSHGLSIKITKGLWYRPSYHTGGAEVKVTPVDEGQFSITNKRVIYTYIFYIFTFIFLDAFNFYFIKLFIKFLIFMT